ncbi:MAG: hypothetical protein SF052_19530 [Bacteroidia bacterium]|nr:hypothetical protein [Bacteroidia bacterium]
MFDQQQLELILNRLRDYGQIFRRKRWLILIGGIVMGLVMGFLAYQSAVTYKAVTIFHPDTGGQQNTGLRTNPLSFILGGNSKEGSEAGFMMGILKSRNITESVAGDTIDFNGNRRLVADIVYESIPKSLNPIAVFRRIFMPPPANRPLDLKVTHIGKLIRENMLLETTEEGFIQFEFTFMNEELVKLLSEKCMTELDEYYRHQKTEKAEENFLFFEYRADSVKKELDKANRSVARFYDETKFGVKASNEVFIRDQEAKIKLLTELYIELEISKEQAKAQFQKDTPVIQILDHPTPPYEEDKHSAPLFALLGFLITAILLLLFFTRKLWSADLRSLVQSQLITSAEKKEAKKTESEEE